KRAYCLKIQPATGSFARNLIYSTKPAGESNKQIGRLLNISTGTVKAHLESLYQRLEVKNRTQAAMMLNDAI
ncbi:LuxR C-terminal-related transcriptional regulator, partial [Citrobacter freundii]|uniref:response regulator transcription factor n=1 Tax=Citrobacter freundii TaxID=546 RepID=UPI00292B09B4